MSEAGGVLTLDNESQTRQLAAALAAVAQPGDVIALDGTLGTGKSTLARAFVQKLAGLDEEVPSPTFTLVQTYDTETGTIFHYDLYRLDSPDEALELGIEEAFADGICLIEWPDRLGPLLPAKTLTVKLALADSPDARAVTIAAPLPWHERIERVLTTWRTVSF